jgi:hypothetical protein
MNPIYFPISAANYISEGSKMKSQRYLMAPDQIEIVGP